MVVDQRILGVEPTPVIVQGFVFVVECLSRLKYLLKADFKWTRKCVSEHFSKRASINLISWQEKVLITLHPDMCESPMLIQFKHDIIKRGNQRLQVFL